MGLSARKNIGIAIGARALHVTEARASNGGCRVVRSAVFQLGEQDSYQNAAALGKKLAQFLKQNQFSCSQAVFGIPAQWLMFKEKTVPAASSQMLTSMLRIQAETQFSLEPGTLVVDYTTGSASSEGQAVVLVAALRERIEQLRTLAAAAGLKLQSITPTGLALSAASGSANVLHFGANGAELITRGAAGLPRLCHVSSDSVVRKQIGSKSTTPELAGELHRALTLTQQNGSAGPLDLWDDVGLPPALVQEFSSETKMPIRPGRHFSGIPIEGMSDGAGIPSGSAALAALAIKPALLAIDLLHPRLAEPKPPLISSRTALLGLGAAALIAIVAMFTSDWIRNAAEVADLRRSRDDMKENTDNAKAFINRVNTVRGWYERRPNYLESLRAITLTFPEEGRIWVSTLNLHEDMRGVLSGRAVDEKTVLELLDKLKSKSDDAPKSDAPSAAAEKPADKAKPGTEESTKGGDRSDVADKSKPSADDAAKDENPLKVTDLKLLHMRSSGPKNSEVSFALSFKFVPKDQNRDRKGAADEPGANPPRDRKGAASGSPLPREGEGLGVRGQRRPTGGV
ncbi:MAG TPA: hypothetical protein VGP72_10635 [Planctomycetota bacterium]|jgi:hypothetical protein